MRYAPIGLLVPALSLAWSDLAKEIGLQRGAEDVLLFRERRQYLRAVQEALAGAEAARVVLEGVVRRLGAR
jgi:hypothetical protein